MMKESMYKAGVVAEPTPMDFSLFYKNAMDHNFDGMLGGWGGSASYSNPMQLMAHIIMGYIKDLTSVDLVMLRVML